ncbi:hypothetical protein IHQ71_13990 [Rhizobium sp. TH2]|uniref:hypothetical protein n=1 Tax=Rhizobium sp. TH2 TaxID=2775403 RepID=UPI0021571CF3|nr:hypothetical protein [Rhizobium sp. TH2]UVC11592.1 hypothetical protein IHQ71_13990 [Rhizobium sp. TH2]
MTAAPFPDRDAVADRLASFVEADQSFLRLLMENPVQDDNLLEGLRLWLDRSAEAKFLNSLKLERTGEWIGANAPARLQIRLNEVGKSSQHPAFHAFRDGLEKSGGLEKAFPKA